MKQRIKGEIMNEVTGNISFEQNDLGWDGSQMRCLLLTSMGRASLRDTLMQVINQTKEYANIKILDNFEYYPKGIVNPKEIELDKQLIPIDHSIKYCYELYKWWLGDTKKRERTPVWDMAVTAEIDNTPGLILIEAKAHEGELNKEKKGKDKPSASRESMANHERIGKAIDEAREGLNRASQSDKIKIDRDMCYQMSNRLAFAWKLARLGIPAVLIYLGFENTTEMIDGRKNRLLKNYEQWKRTVNEHSKMIGFDLWEIPITVEVENAKETVNIYPMIRSVDIKLEKGSLDTLLSVKRNGLGD